MPYLNLSPADRDRLAGALASAFDVPQLSTLVNTNFETWPKTISWHGFGIGLNEIAHQVVDQANGHGAPSFPNLQEVRDGGAQRRSSA